MSRNEKLFVGISAAVVLTMVVQSGDIKNRKVSEEK